MNFKSCWTLLVLTATLLGLSACEDSDAKKIAQAQNCLNKTSDSTYQDAAACMSYIVDVDSQQANILKCSISFVSGGLTTTKITDAYKALNKEDANKEAVFIGTLTLDSKAKANDATIFCERSGVPSLIYLASLSKVGTYLMAGIGFGGGIPSEAEVEQAVQNCIDNPGDCDDAEVGQAVAVVGEAYCSQTKNKDSDVCKKVNNAIDAHPGDYEAIAQELYQLLNP